jgi:2-polyprenyl-6-methoxyphenol hydroxylase-like FAD-dependent oxidoreductase
MQIAIVGAGTAGLAATLYLARDGHHVTLFERAENPGPVGAGILLQPPGQAVLQDLGLADALAAVSTPVHRLFGTGHQGHTALDLRYGAEKGWGVHRGQLFNLLLTAVRAAQASAGGDMTGMPETALSMGISGQPSNSSAGRIAFHSGVDIATLDAQPERVTLRTSAGATHGPYDLVVLADGTHSHLRDARLPHRVTTYPWGAFWVALPDPNHSRGNTLRQWYRHANQMLGLMPSGFAPAGSAHARTGDGAQDSAVPMVTLFWSVRTQEFAQFQQTGLAAWKAQVRALTHEADPFLDQLRDISQLTPASYADVRMPRWHGAGTHERVVVLGDAAHGMSPQLGQGTTMALIDAQVLARVLREHGVAGYREAGATDAGAAIGAAATAVARAGTGAAASVVSAANRLDIDDARHVPKALAAYTRARRSHLGFYQFASSAMTPLYQGEAVWPAWLRDRLMAPASKLPGMHTLMLNTLSGQMRWWPW